MKTLRFVVLVTLALAVCPAPRAMARLAGGGKPAKADCYVEVDGADPVRPNKQGVAKCTDGDPACDTDGSCTNKSCTFSLTVCAHQADISSCTSPNITGITVVPPGALALPPVPASSEVCGNATDVVVPLGNKKMAKKVIRLTAPSDGTPTKDGDRIVLICKKNTAGCGPAPTCAKNPAGGPRQITLATKQDGTDLDTGFTGISHNFPVDFGSQLVLCLTDCDASSNPLCTVTSPTGAGSVNGEFFGAPLPLFTAGAPVCVINKFAEGENITGSMNVQTGEVHATVHQGSEVWLANGGQPVCPQCSGQGLGKSGSCNAGARKGKPCKTDGVTVVQGATYNVSTQCPPGGDQAVKQATLDITLPLTSETTTLAANAAGSFPCPAQTTHDQCGSQDCTNACAGTAGVNGGVNQFCCGTTPCFPTRSGQAIERSGARSVPQPAWPNTDYPKTGNDGALATVFCIAKTGSPIVDGVSGLPAPGGLLLPGVEEMLDNSSAPE